MIVKTLHKAVQAAAVGLEVYLLRLEETVEMLTIIEDALDELVEDIEQRGTKVDTHEQRLSDFEAKMDEVRDFLSKEAQRALASGMQYKFTNR